MDHLVDILIPCRNGAATIVQTLDSCLAAGRELIGSIIVIDDHSNDDTTKLVERWSKTHRDIAVKTRSNRGTGACSARNTAFQLSHSRLLLWLDADDLLGEDSLRTAVELAKGRPELLVVTPWVKFQLDNPRAALGEAPWAQFQHGTVLDPYAWLDSAYMTVPACILGHRALFTRTGAWDEALLIDQDGEFMCRAVCHSQGVVVSTASRVYYRTNATASVSTLTTDKVSSLLRSARSFEAALAHWEGPQPTVDLLARRYLRALYAAISVPCPAKVANDTILELERLNCTELICEKIAKRRMSRALARAIGYRRYVHVRRLTTSLRASLLGTGRGSMQRSVS